ncbi:MAG TPA: hypothetical protein V6D15_15920 [Oculatellaceae cyanobacterium]|jgi:hypothetical protein
MRIKAFVTREIFMAFYNELNDHTNFFISFSNAPRYDFAVFAKGYKFAANLIAEELIESYNFPYYQAYPVVFLYRHALELQLKSIIYGVAKLLFFKDIEDIDNKLYNHHDLSKLSEKAYHVITQAFPDDVTLQKLLEKVVRVAKDFSEIDPNSFAYRYPINKNGEHSTQRNQFVNLRSLATHMDNLLSELEVIEFGLNVETDLAQEVYEILESL